jgi:hypothetical protein
MCRCRAAVIVKKKLPRRCRAAMKVKKKLPRRCRAAMKVKKKLPRLYYKICYRAAAAPRWTSLLLHKDEERKSKIISEKQKSILYQHKQNVMFNKYIFFLE